MLKRITNRTLAACVALAACCGPALAAGDVAPTPWWVWPLALFAVSFALGLVAVMAGVGGGVLFVPIVSGAFPFHIDFVRGAGLMLALAGAVAAGPVLLRSGLASLRLAMPFALVGSITSIAGAVVGLALPQAFVQISLAVAILGIAALMLRAGNTERPTVRAGDRLATYLGVQGAYRDPASGANVDWTIHRGQAGVALFAAIGFMAGFFGLGAGWANVPALNLVMGAPLKVSVATSSFMLSIVDTSAAWVYINRGAVLPMLAVPSILGMMIGARIGARLVRTVRAATIRRFVIGLLLVAGLRALARGTGVWT